LPVGQKSYRTLGIDYPAPRRGRDEAHVPAPDPEWGLGADTMRDRAAKPSPFWLTGPWPLAGLYTLCYPEASLGRSRLNSARSEEIQAMAGFLGTVKNRQGVIAAAAVGAVCALAAGAGWYVYGPSLSPPRTP